MFALSVIVPKLDDQVAFENTLASVLRFKSDNTQILAVHGGDYDDPHNLQGEVEYVIAEGKTKLVSLFNAAVAMADGEVVHLICPGIELTAEIAETAYAAFGDPRVASIVPVVVLENGLLAAAGVSASATMHRRLVGAGQPPKRVARMLRRTLGPCSWAAFYRRDALLEIGAVDESLDDAYLDLDLALSLRSAEWETQLADERIWLSRQQKLTTLQDRLAEGRGAQRMIQRHPALGRGSVGRQTGRAMLLDAFSCLLQPGNVPSLWGRVLGSFKGRADRLASAGGSAAGQNQRAA